MTNIASTFTDRDILDLTAAVQDDNPVRIQAYQGMQQEILDKALKHALIWSKFDAATKLTKMGAQTPVPAPTNDEYLQSQIKKWAEHGKRIQKEIKYARMRKLTDFVRTATTILTAISLIFGAVSLMIGNNKDIPSFPGSNPLPTEPTQPVNTNDADFFLPKKDNLIAQARRAFQPTTLTSGEYALAQGVFGNQIDYQKVSVLNKQSTYYVGLRGSAAAWVNSGESRINLAPDYHTDDFNQASSNKKSIFMHEFTHVWQHQNKTGTDCTVYGYPMNATTKFSDLCIEQQGSVIGDYTKYILNNGEKVQERKLPYFKVELSGQWLITIYGKDYFIQLARVVEQQFPKARETRLRLEQERQNASTQTPASVPPTPAKTLSPIS